MTKINALLDKMWTDYTALNPQAQKIVNLLKSKGDDVVNDHIALRTFNHPKINLDVLSKSFLEAGYEHKGDYSFEQKKLKAKHFEHSDPTLPLIFISELLLEEFSGEFNEIVNRLIEQTSEEQVNDYHFSSNGRPWNISSDDYKALQRESDYGAWLGAIGFRPNHFTVSINQLGSFEEVSELNSFLKSNDIKLNESGGEIKGSKEVCLEQSSTLADSVEVEFSDTKLIIPSCYFEFAKRYPLEDGKLYTGFVAKSADKIFESTDKTQ
jgi:hypothetical protein